VLTSVEELDAREPDHAPEKGKELQLYPSFTRVKGTSGEEAKHVPGKLRGAKGLPVNGTIPADISDSELEMWLRNFSQGSSNTQQDNAEFSKLADKYTFGDPLDSSFILCPKAFGMINIWSSSLGPFGEGPHVLFGAKGAQAGREAEDEVEDDGDDELLEDEEMQLANANMFSRRAARRDEGVDNSRALAMKNEARQSPAPLHKAVDGGAPYMVLMMPSSSVRWNGNPLKVDSTDSEDNETETEDDSWLEIGVKLVHARVVSHSTHESNVNYAI
jgi:hypothetical protein